MLLVTDTIANSIINPATNLNPGRVIALFCFCYEVCIAYLDRHPQSTFFDFLARLLSLFTQFLASSKFYEWLQNLGGWVRTPL